MTSMNLDSAAITEAEVEKLWKAFSVFDTDGSGLISVEELENVIRSLGQTPSMTELRDLIKEVDVDRSGSINFDEFNTLMIARQGDRKSRLKLAFTVFDKDNSGRITADEMRSVMHQFELTDAELDAMVKEVDGDGDGSIGFEEFCQLVLEEGTGDATSTVAVHPTPVPATTVSPISTNSAAPSTQPAEVIVVRSPVQEGSKPVAEEITAEEITAEVNPELARLRALLAQHPQDEKVRGTSRLQMQIGLFRLIQGAAYRCFRESFSANHETHLQVKNLPYRITDFVPFVQTAIALYKGLGIVEETCHPVLDAVAESISAEYTRLEERIRDWPTVAKTPEMLAEEAAMLAARSQSVNAREKFAAGVEFAITMKKQKLSLGDIVEGVLAFNELNRLRELELQQEFAPPPSQSEGDPKLYLQRWHRVILANALETVDGAMMPVEYWYEDFMPKLLAAFSITTAADVQSNTVPDEAALNQWYECTQASGEFDRYGSDVAEYFPHCRLDQKLRIKQAWLQQRLKFESPPLFKGGMKNE